MRLADLTDRSVVVWGLGVEGAAAMRLLPELARPHSLVAVVDGDTSLDALDTADVVVKSPGVSLYRPEAQRLAARGALTSGTALLLAERDGRGVVGVTGSKGKSTTTTMLAHLWSALAGPVALGGNVGRAPLELTVPARPERIALEVSSYQAADVDVSPEAGILTALFPDHLSWHGSLERYLADKLNLFAHGSAFVAADGTSALVRDVADRLPAPIWFGVDGGWHVADGIVRAGAGAMFPVDALQLPGPHNGRNLCGVLAVLDGLGLDPRARAEEVEAAVRTYQPLPYRLEPVGTADGVEIIDDGMASNPTAAAAAIGSFPGRPLVVLLGGSDDRHLPFDPIVTAVAARAEPTVCVCFGAAGARIARDLAAGALARGVHTHDGFDAAVDDAAHAARATGAGSVLLLSPGAPSFDQFADYRARSARFRHLLGLDPPRAEL